MEECCLPACSPGLTLPALSKHAGPPSQEWYHIYGLGPATPITSWANSLQTHLSLSHTPCFRRSQHLIILLVYLFSILALQGVLQIFLTHGGNTSAAICWTLLWYSSLVNPRNDLNCLCCLLECSQPNAMLFQSVLSGFRYLCFFTLWRQDSHEHTHSAACSGRQRIVSRNWFSPFSMWFLGIELRLSAILLTLISPALQRPNYHACGFVVWSEISWSDLRWHF